MTLKRSILSLLTLLVLVLVGSSLIESWNKPQVTSRLQLSQSNLLLQAAEWQGVDLADTDWSTVRNAFLGSAPIETALNQYQEVRQEAQTNQDRAQKQLSRQSVDSTAPTDSPQGGELQSTTEQLQQFIGELDLRIGVLQASQGKTDTALATWAPLVNGEGNFQASTIHTAQLLDTLWQAAPQALSSPPEEGLPKEQVPAEKRTATATGVLVSQSPSGTRFDPDLDPEQYLQQTFSGWFRYQTLEKLYQLQVQNLKLSELEQTEQAAAEQAFLKLAFVGSIPAVGFVLGIGLILFLIGQRLFRGSQAVLAQNAAVAWSTPWDGETVWQVLIVGFFFVGQVILPLLFQLILPRLLAPWSLNLANLDYRGQAFYTLFFYLAMAASGVAVLYGSIRSHFPLPSGWFRIKWLSGWPLWGLGGYLVALPMVTGMSVINQLIWQGQGGSNPLLERVLEANDTVALGVFFFTAAVAAPLFEEFLFRGFLLASLTRHLPVWGAILASSALFALAHLSLSEVLPLTVLGIILGVVYTRSRNLLAPMLLHSLWNSATMLGLFILGSAAK